MVLVSSSRISWDGEKTCHSLHVSVVSVVESIQLFTCWHIFYSSPPPHCLLHWPRDQQDCLTFQKAKRHSWTIQLTRGEKQFKPHRVISYQECCLCSQDCSHACSAFAGQTLFQSIHWYLLFIQMLVHHSFCIMLPAHVSRSEGLSELDFGNKFLLWAFACIFVWLDRSELSQCSCMNSYSVQWELVKVCVKWMDTADTSGDLLMEMWGEIADIGNSGGYLGGSMFSLLSKICRIQCNFSGRRMRMWLNSVFSILLNFDTYVLFSKYFDLPQHSLVCRWSW